ncbi:delta 9-fatty acid desaturase [Pyrrhoderma noxium]|uniref:Delta 9-fatty acid desaturase n=1 Tax=Pyrrhoderma noxium TaxID=2282107 RepID=A0A286UT26_9AGAM|nr:delta 9-fatty acid desaturase [Pyrrhoderma noxium]
MSKSVPSNASSPPLGKFWWGNAVLFVGTHIAACIGMYLRPVWVIPRATLLLGILDWQASMFGITVGYHRLYSHRAFRAPFGVRLFLMALGSMGFQGSIKWWYV